MLNICVNLSQILVGDIFCGVWRAGISNGATSLHNLLQQLHLLQYEVRREIYFQSSFIVSESFLTTNTHCSAKISCR